MPNFPRNEDYKSVTKEAGGSEVFVLVAPASRRLSGNFMEEKTARPSSVGTSKKPTLPCLDTCGLVTYCLPHDSKKVS
jgi:hypothetical protein